MSKKKAVEVVDMEEAQSSFAQEPEQDSGTKFYFGNMQLLRFKDGTTFHAKKQRETIRDTIVIENLKEAAKNPTNRIFIEE